MLRKAQKYMARKKLTPSFHEAVFEGQVDLVTEMLEVDPMLAVTAKQDGTQAIHLLNTCAADEILDLLLSHGADVMSRNKGGVTPLHTVIDEDAGLKLIANGADVNATDLRGLTPLMSIAEQPQHSLPIAMVLIKAGAELANRDQAGRTALDIAQSNGAHELTHLFMKAGAL
ncbi:ankyrin repeat domain-containing protein [Yoonia sp. 1_MG-2023]|nr:ankyrin repeat domain-containing protein [Yoonia sp. 1_MG-2023]